MIIEKFLDPNAPSLPKQVAENTKDIEALSESFRTSESLTSNSTSVDISTTNIDIKDAECSIGRFLYSTNGLMFKIVAVEGNKVFIDFYSNLTESAGVVVSTQNMLINPAFIINQDAMQDYSGDGIYTADQWIMESSETIVTPHQTGGATFKNNGNSEHFIEQIVEISDELNTIGKPHTASVELTDGTIAEVTITPLLETDVSKKVIFETGAISLEWDASEDFLIYRVYANQGETLEIKNCVLVQSDKRGVFVPRPIKEEEELCFKYYYKIKANSAYASLSIGVEQSANAYSLFIFKKMRTTPIIKHGGNFNPQYNTSGTIEVSIKNISVNQISENIINCIVNINETLQFTYGKFINLRSNNNINTFITLDARIY